MIEPSEYELRRNKLFNLLEPNSVAIFFAGAARKQSGDSFYEFEPNRSFYY